MLTLEQLFTWASSVSSLSTLMSVTREQEGKSAKAVQVWPSSVEPYSRYSAVVPDIAVP